MVRGNVRTLFSQFESKSCKKGNTDANLRYFRGRRRRRGRLGRSHGSTTARRRGKVVIADLADDKGKELASELGVRYARTDATNTEDVSAQVDQDAAAPNVTPARPSAPNATLA